MNRRELETLFGETVRSDQQSSAVYERLAAAVVETYDSGDKSFREHISNRSRRVAESTGQAFDPERFDLATARAFIADEVGFTSWDELLDALENGRDDRQPILFRYAVAALSRGDFTILERSVGGPNAFEHIVIDWFEKGYFTYESETLAEAFAAACWLGHAKTAGYLLDKGVDPYAGIRTGLSGFHWAASSGKADVIKMLVARKIPMAVKSIYDSTVLGQALWSAINESTPYHGELIEVLIEGGAYIWPDTLEWWDGQDVPSAETKRRVAEALRKAEDKK